MYQTKTFAMHHPEHGECVADETSEPQLVDLGWTRETAAPAGGSEGAPGGKKKDKAKGAASPAAPAGGAEGAGAESLEDLI